MRADDGKVIPRLKTPSTAGWQSGYAAACKAVDAGSTPASASIFTMGEPMR